MTIVTATFNETRKGILILWTYRINLLINLIAMSVTFVGISFLMSNGNMQPEALASILLGYLIWYYVILTTSNMGENFVEEGQTGTLEQMFISPVPISFILIGRSFANILISSIQIALIGGVLILLLAIPLRWHWEALSVIVIGMLGLFGFGFMLSGLTLIFKQAHAIVNLSNNALIFLNGALVPIDIFPKWLVVITKILPSTQAIVVLRSVLLNGMSLTAVWNDGSLPLLIVHSTVYLIGGWAVLQWCTRLAKQKGTLGQY